MKIYFVRHGHPENDRLTPLGQMQAEAAADRLKNVDIEAIYSSTLGRAMETAETLAKPLGLSVIPCEFIREINWSPFEGENIVSNGQPWGVSKSLVSRGISLTDKNWRENDPYDRCRIPESVDTVVNGLDLWLEDLGYKREGEYYRVTCDNPKKAVAMFSHCGSSSVAISHLLNIPFPQFCGMFHINFTGITAINLPGERGDLVCPVMTTFDASHIIGLEAKNTYSS